MRRRLLALMATLIAIASIAAGCGSSGGGSASSSSTQSTPSTQSTQSTQSGGSSSGSSNANAAGKKVFTSDCGSCHTLADAGTNGTIGPDLDQLKPSKSAVKNQVINGGGPMPAFGKQGILDQKQINDVSAYVASKAGQ